MRRLIVCADGTWNTADQRVKDGVAVPTNVVRLARAALPVDATGTSQIVYYHAGVGTHWGLDHFLGGAFGLGLSRNIVECYGFLVDNYTEGDEIFLFGFSRGAYTARSLAGLIRNSGLVAKAHADRIPEAYRLYRDRTDATAPDAERSRDFRLLYAREVRIKCIGVWDTVGALGIPLSGLGALSGDTYQFHDMRLSRTVDNAFHALAIDERRVPFAPALWEVRPQSEQEAMRGAGNLQRVEQTWFTGVHSDIGGGYEEPGLCNTTMLWMVERAAQCGLALDMDYIRSVCSPDAEPVLHDSLSPFYKVAFAGGRERRIASRANVDATAIELLGRTLKLRDVVYDPPNIPRV